MRSTKSLLKVALMLSVVAAASGCKTTYDNVYLTLSGRLALYNENSNDAGYFRHIDNLDTDLEWRGLDKSGKVKAHIENRSISFDEITLGKTSIPSDAKDNMDEFARKNITMTLKVGNVRLSAEKIEILSYSGEESSDLAATIGATFRMSGTDLKKLVKLSENQAAAEAAKDAKAADVSSKGNLPEGQWRGEVQPASGGRQAGRAD